MPRTVALFSLGGAPGATTAALALAAVWPGEAVLVEADASGGDVATWQRLQPAPGLTGLAAAARHDTASGTAPADHTQALPGGLAVCPAPVTAERAGGAVRLLSQNPSVLLPGTGPATVLDLGRLAPGSPAAALAARADAALLLVADDVAQLRRAKEASATLAETLPGLRTVVTGGKGGTKEITEALGPGVWGRLPADPRAAAFLRGEADLRRPHRRPLFRAASRLAADLAATGTRTEPQLTGAPA
ncbi:hypothetical protein [Nocardiopsis algeriensis]|uniref:MinD-like ATPase involved in chromosome partitioning or flagellar assembly n=1 Tax=Nocardiopsis algeriensis TaxID=1478215 RepID=A0A841IK57_9ACTN|nr:hypothetical protein [Nocardiopsis algeriensis]MBB6119159.1 hypothetical protein [Nocardiopsis algeriensis]